MNARKEPQFHGLLYTRTRRPLIYRSRYFMAGLIAELSDKWAKKKRRILFSQSPTNLSNSERNCSNSRLLNFRSIGFNTFRASPGS